MPRFDFAFDDRYRKACRPFGVHPESAWVEVDDEALTARFGPWVVRTSRANVVSATRTGPYSVAKTIGPARLSVADRGLTFATNREAGLCLRFAEPVTGIDPIGIIRHPGLTVTVRSPDALADAIA